MLVHLIELGDERGVRIPTTLLDQIGASETVEILAEAGRLVIQPARSTRRQWEQALAALIDWVDGAATMGEVPDLPVRPG